MTKLLVPTIHSNGTSAEDLLNQLETASEALRVALDALRDATPHGRDYYVQSPDATSEARKAHTARTLRVQETYDEIREIHLAVHNQANERNRR